MRHYLSHIIIVLAQELAYVLWKRVDKEINMWICGCSQDSAHRDFVVKPVDGAAVVVLWYCPPEPQTWKMLFVLLLPSKAQ